MIRELSFIENLLFRIGAVLMLVGVAAHIFSTEISLYVYGIGVMLFCIMQLRAVYEGTDLNVIRLRRQQIFACLMFVGAVLFISSDLPVGMNGLLPCQ